MLLLEGNLVRKNSNKFRDEIQVFFFQVRLLFSAWRVLRSLKSFSFLIK